VTYICVKNIVVFQNNCRHFHCFSFIFLLLKNTEYLYKRIGILKALKNVPFDWVPVFGFCFFVFQLSIEKPVSEMSLQMLRDDS